jgi:hypothetical protein
VTAAVDVNEFVFKSAIATIKKVNKGEHQANGTGGKTVWSKAGSAAWGTGGHLWNSAATNGNQASESNGTIWTPGWYDGQVVITYRSPRNGGLYKANGEADVPLTFDTATNGFYFENPTLSQVDWKGDDKTVQVKGNTRGCFFDMNNVISIMGINDASKSAGNGGVVSEWSNGAASTTAKGLVAVDGHREAAEQAQGNFEFDTTISLTGTITEFGPKVQDVSGEPEIGKFKCVIHLDGKNAGSDVGICFVDPQSGHFTDTTRAQGGHPNTAASTPPSGSSGSSSG